MPINVGKEAMGKNALSRKYETTRTVTVPYSPMSLPGVTEGIYRGVDSLGDGVFKGFTDRCEVEFRDGLIIVRKWYEREDLK